MIQIKQMLLRKLESDLEEETHEKPVFSREFYFALAERIVADHIPLYKELNSTKSVKLTTKKDLYRRILLSKEYIDAHFRNEISVLTLANVSKLSEYHFYRNFKLIYGISPLQYIIRKRLLFGLELIKIHKTTVTETALLCFYMIVNFIAL